MASELHLMSLRELKQVAERHGLPMRRKDVIINQILRARETEEERIRWWNAMRRLRKHEGFHDTNDEGIVVEVRDELGLGTADVTARNLEVASGEIGGRISRVSAVPHRLTRSEILTELGKHSEHRGATHEEIEAEYGRVPSTEKLRDALDRLGGPSSSSPERTKYDTYSALRRLEETEAFGGAGRDEILARIFGITEEGEAVNVDRVARGFDFWEGRTPPVPRADPSSAEDFLAELRGNRKDPSDQELIEEFEGDSGPACLRGAEEAISVEETPKDFRWWDAMRKARTLNWWAGNRHDEFYVAAASSVDGRTTPTDLARLYDDARTYGVGSYARVPVKLTRSELIAELAKFPRYEGVEDLDEVVPSRGRVATTWELEEHLNSLGGPSSSSPEASGGWWEAMRNLRTLHRFQTMTDEEVASMARTPDEVKSLYGEARREGTPLRDPLRNMVFPKCAAVPRKLSKREVYAELARTPKYSGADPLELEETLGMDVKEAMAHLNLLGGPASSDPLGHKD